MKSYDNIEKILVDLKNIDINEWVYVNLESWNNTPKNTKLFYIPEDEIFDLDENGLAVESSSGEIIPQELEAEDIHTWLESQTLKSIISILSKKNANPDLDLIIKAINYYREEDDFFE